MATTVALWEDLLEGEEIAYRGLEPPRTAQHEPLPDDLDPRVASSLVQNGVTSALPPPGRDVGSRAARRERRRHHGNRFRQVPCLQSPRSRRDRARAEDAGAVPLPDKGARARPGARARRVAAQRAAPGDLRRRHARGAPLADPQVVEPHPHESGHAPRRRSPSPRPLGRRAPQPAFRRRGRGARVPRSLRIARRERASAAATARSGVRRRAAVPARVGNHRERGRARRVAHGRAGDRRRAGHVGELRARGRHLEPAASRPRPRPQGEPSRRGSATALAAHDAWAAERSASRRAGRRRS